MVDFRNIENLGSESLQEKAKGLLGQSFVLAMMGQPFDAQAIEFEGLFEEEALSYEDAYEAQSDLILTVA